METQQKLLLLTDWCPDSQKLPAYCQPKLDGLRAVYVPGDGLWTRNEQRPGRRITSLPHLDAALAGCTLRLDGELYVHGWPLGRIAGAVRRRASSSPDCQQIEYHVFDCIAPGSATDRLEMVARALRDLCDPIFAVPTCRVTRRASVVALYGRYIADGYEGLVWRAAGAEYTYGRSKHVQRLKPNMFSEGA